MPASRSGARVAAVCATFALLVACSKSATKDTTAPVTTATPPGGWHTSDVSVTLACADAGGCAETRFTLDGTTPTGASTLYVAPIAISTDAILKFFSVDRAGNAEQVRTEIYAFDRAAPVTTATPASGAYGAVQTVVLACDDGTGSGCAGTRYTTDGSLPTAASPPYSGPIVLTANAVLQFFSIDAAGNAETVRTETYVVDLAPPVTTASPPGGLYASAQSVTLSCDDGAGSGCAATYYTTDGTTPATTSSVYAGPITISADTTLRFFSVDAVGHEEAPSTAAYRIDTVPPHVASVAPAAGAEGVARTAAVSVVFDEDVDPATVTQATFLLRVDGAPVAAAVAYDAASRTATLTPTSQLPWATLARVEVTAGVRDLAGNALAPAYASAFTTVAPPAVRLDRDSAPDHRGLEVAWDAGGNGMAAWIVAAGSGAQILASPYSAATGTWGPEVAVVPRLGTSSTTLSIASDGGSFVLVWVGPDATSEQSIWYSRYSSGTWSAPALVETASGPAYNAVRVAANGNGYGAMWAQYAGGSARVFASFLGAGGWSTPEIVDDGTGSVDVYDGFALAGAGGTYAFAWGQFDGTSYRIYARVGTGGVWGALAKIDGAAGGSYGPSIAAAGTTGYGVAFVQGNAVNFARFAFNGATWTWSAAPVVLSGTNASSRPRIASDGSGYAVSWSESALARARVATCAATCAWSATQQLPAALYSYNDTAIASDGSGYAVVWHQLDTQDRVQARRYAGGAWGAVETVAGSANPFTFTMSYGGGRYVAFWVPFDTFDGYWLSARGASAWGAAQRLPVGTYRGSSATPSLAAAGGTSIVVWQQQKGPYWWVWSAIHDATGWHDPALLSTDGYGTGYTPVATTNGSTIAVAWQSNGGIQAKVYTPGTGWSATQVLGVYGWDLRIASDGSGYALLWREGGSGGALRWIRFTGGAWGAAADVATGLGYAYDPHRLASNGAGYAVVWQDVPAGATVYGVYGKRFDGSSWSATEQVSASSSHVWKPQLASNGSGYLAAWYDQGSTLQNLGPWARPWARDAGGVFGWLPPQQIANENAYYSLSLSPDGAGYAAIWATGLSVAQSSARDTGGGVWAWDAPATLDDGSGGAASRPSLRAAGSSAFAVWVRAEVSRARLHCARRGAAAWGDGAVAQDLPGDAHDPVAVALDGAPAILWTQDHPGDENAQDLMFASGY